MLGRLDPWAALLLGVLLALGVIILLATPGPWHKVVGPAVPVQLRPPAPANIAVFALGGADGSCTATIWLHVDQARPGLTAVVLAPETQGFVPRGGFTPLRRIVDQAGPGSAASAMGEALGVTMDAWVALDREALRMVLAPHALAGEARGPLLEYVGAQPAWEGRGETREVWDTQYRVLGPTLARLPYAGLNIVAFSNYVLGWGHVQSDLDLQGATSLAATLQELVPSDVAVRALAARVEVCRDGEAWLVAHTAAAQLRSALALGQVPPPASPTVLKSSRPARVLVVLPGQGRQADVYVREVRRRLRRSAGAPVAVRVVRAPLWEDLVGLTTAATRSWRPLAVLVGPAASPLSDETAARAADALVRLGRELRATGQPAVLSAPLPVEATTTAPLPAGVTTSGVLAAALRAGGQPVSPLAAPGMVVAGEPEPALDPEAQIVRAARANVATLVRACWPGTLAPDLTSTRLGFSFAGRRRTPVGVSVSADGATPSVLPLLRAWGYQARVVEAVGWTPKLRARSVSYRAGMRRAALALAGDLGLRKTLVVQDETAPAAVTLSLKR